MAKGAYAPPLIAVVFLCFTLCLANFGTFYFFAPPPMPLPKLSPGSTTGLGGV